jgi:DNA-binding transcriptional regulator YiaG
MKRTSQAKIIRRALNLTQEEFALRYHPEHVDSTINRVSR